MLARVHAATIYCLHRRRIASRSCSDVSLQASDAPRHVPAVFPWRIPKERNRYGARYSSETSAARRASLLPRGCSLHPPSPARDPVSFDLIHVHGGLEIRMVLRSCSPQTSCRRILTPLTLPALIPAIERMFR